jgi:isoquinoline 1-oxidoreductase beta subunit
MGKWTRRAFITVGSVVGGGLALGVAGVAFAPNRLTAGRKGRLTTWLEISPDNQVTVIAPHCEMGQGSQTALAMMAAEELDADWSLVKLVEAPALSEYANGYLVRAFVPAFATVPRATERAVDYATYRLTRIMNLQVTGGSSSIRGTGFYGMRMAGAAAKDMLIRAAAKRWNVPAEECVAALSKITHAKSERSATYGELAADAAQFDVPAHPPMKKPSEYRIVGTPRPRFDIPSKVNGSAIYGIDVTVPGMMYASVRAAPIFGGKLTSVDSTAASAMPGVKRVVQLDNAVAVVADGYWHALKALRSLEPAFTSAGHEAVTSDSLYGVQSQLLSASGLKKVIKSGNGAAALQGAAQTVKAEYRVPFLAHATMEPMNATARVADGKCEVWVGVQDPLAARKVAAEASGLKEEDVTIHNQQLGGGFGRRLPGVMDYVDQAVRIAKAMSPAPVKTLWSREEDIQHDFYRPAITSQMEGLVDAKGGAQAWVQRFINFEDGEAALHHYAIPHVQIDATDHAHHVRTGAWRSVAASQHGFFTESFVDELAHAANKDPLEFRLALLERQPRHHAVLKRAAELGEWGAPLEAGEGRGVALVECFGTIVAEVARVRVGPEGKVRVQSVHAVADCGDVVNPDTAKAQIEGGIIFGMSAALFNGVTIRGGRVEQSNFSDLPMPKMADAPRITVEFIRSGAPLGGLGEPGVPPIAPAIGNAIFAATGKRVRTLPLKVVEVST